MPLLPFYPPSNPLKIKANRIVAACDLCASAAYYVAVHCNEIIAANTISVEFGSIGVMMSFMDYENTTKRRV